MLATAGAEAPDPCFLFAARHSPIPALTSLKIERRLSTISLIQARLVIWGK